MGAILSGPFESKTYLNPVMGSRIIAVEIPKSPYRSYMPLLDLGLTKAPTTEFFEKQECFVIRLLLGRRGEEIQFHFTGHKADERALEFLSAFGKEFCVEYVRDKHIRGIYLPKRMATPKNHSKTCFDAHCSAAQSKSGGHGELMGP